MSTPTSITIKDVTMTVSLRSGGVSPQQAAASAVTLSSFVPRYGELKATNAR